MSLLDLGSDQTIAAAPRQVAAPKPPAKFSAWSAIPRGVAEAGAQVAATGAELLGGFGQVMGAYPEIMGVMPDAATRKQADEARAKLLRDGVVMNNAVGDSIRAAGDELRPDAATASAAEQLLYGFSRGASKVVAGALTAGPAGVIAAGLEEANTASEDLRKQGVGFGARTGAGLVQGAGLALAALPAAGATLKSTAALYLAGGPGGYLAQQALTREILRNAGNDRAADQYDPFDPVGLAVSALIPLPFAAMGLRANRRAAAQAFSDGPVPSERTAVAGAVDQVVHAETVDAARVALLAERRAASNIHTFGTRAADAHETAMARAEQQLAQGARVDVADLVEPPNVEAARAFDAQIAALEAQRAELLPVAGQLADRGEVAPIKEQLAQLQQQAPDASDAAVKALAKDLQAADQLSFKQALQEAKRQTAEAVAEHGARIARLESAIQRSAETAQAVQRLAEVDQQLTTLQAQRAEAAPFAAFRTTIADAVQQALREAPQPRSQRAAQATQATNPQAPAPARSAGEPATAAANTGRTAAGVEAAGLTPADKAEGAQVQTRLADLQTQYPDLMVQMDGMDSPMRLADFLASVKAEADEMTADAPLMEVAAQCAILNGP